MISSNLCNRVFLTMSIILRKVKIFSSRILMMSGTKMIMRHHLREVRMMMNSSMMRVSPQIIMISKRKKRIMMKYSLRRGIKSQ